MTYNQLAHRAYLQSDLWKSIRLRAIAHYGSQCNACGSHGTDVHHRNYERVGGRELLSDLEVLCRDCHEARHSAWRGARKSRKPNKTPCLSIVVAYRYLTASQKLKISQQFSMNTVELFLHYRRHDVMAAIGKMLGVNIFELHLERRAKSRHRSKKFKSGRANPPRSWNMSPKTQYIMQMAEREKFKLEELELVTVCDKCLKASCWQAVFMCDESRNAGTVKKSRSELRKLALEHQSYWKTDKQLADE